MNFLDLIKNGRHQAIMKHVKNRVLGFSHSYIIDVSIMPLFILHDKHF